MIPILYADEAMAVCRKSPGLTSEEDGVIGLLRQQLGGEVYPVHRLDKPVGGVLATARTARAAAELSRQFREGLPEKTYLAVVNVQPEPPCGGMTDLLYRDARLGKAFVVTRPRRGVKQARLSYETLLSLHGQTLLRVRPETGRFHQIRVQLASRGCPIAGDRRYGGIRAEELMLFCRSLRLRHPLTGEEMTFTAAPEGLAWEPWLETIDGNTGDGK